MKTGIAKLGCVIVVLSLTFGLAQHSYAQARASSKTSVISIDPLALAYGSYFLLQYEFKTSPTNSWALRAAFQPARETFSGFGLGAAYRFYVADSRALTGLSVAPAADVFFYQSSITGAAGATTFDIGGDLAYKWIFDQFAVEPMLGLRIGFGSQVAYATGFIPVLAVFLGYAF